jgi:hypothetical protein
MSKRERESEAYDDLRFVALMEVFTLFNLEASSLANKIKMDYWMQMLCFEK